jgi:hypothetical protein
MTLKFDRNADIAVDTNGLLPNVHVIPGTPPE